jgi:hypothetical protein
MASLGARTLLIFVLALAASQTGAGEVVYRPKQVLQNGTNQLVLRGNLGGVGNIAGCLDCSYYLLPITPAPPEDTFTVYRTDEVDRLLQISRNEINSSIDAKESALRMEIKDAVTTSLATLPTRLMSDDVKTKIENDVLAQVQALVEERTSAIREEIKSDFEARLKDLENRLNGSR